ncbi:MAG: Txe/YoeB family addiction module toxin [Defluviitaleaceae bacterium]|nr:Txe/YoeB family addiction module toxin [Defluviitaleaceae bacterium]
MIKAWHEIAWEEYVYWQRQDKKTLKKINTLIKDVERNGYKCIGNPEPLKHELSGWWSLEIDSKNRLIFKISNIGERKTIDIMSCKGHYTDK